MLYYINVSRDVWDIDEEKADHCYRILDRLVKSFVIGYFLDDYGLTDAEIHTDLHFIS